MNQYLIAKNHDLNCQSSNFKHSGLGMLLVIDRNVDDIPTLVNGVLTGAKVLVLDSEIDSIEQITNALAEETFNSLHLVSHGAPGVLYLGNNPLTLDNLDRYSYLLQEWGVPEILLYGCNVAAGDAGSEFIEQLHQLTGANIAASRTKTGNSALGGDWNLEVQTNQQLVNLAFSESTMAQYSSVLIERISVASDGTEGDGNGYQSSMSANGRFVAFQASSENLVEGDNNGKHDIFVRDRETGITERISVSTDGTEANNHNVTPSISEDGRYVAFMSWSTNLVDGDNNGRYDIFVHDREAGTTEIVSVNSDVTGGNDHSVRPSISADGRYVTFTSTASNLVAGDNNTFRDVFIHDRETGTTEIVSNASDGTEGNNHAAEEQPSISADGRYVTFTSSSTNLVAGDNNGQHDVFVRDLQTGAIERVSVNSDGTEGNSFSQKASISPDSRYVVFQSNATNLVEGDTNNTYDIFVHDREAGTTERVSVNSDGVESNDISEIASISADGRYVVFWSDATNLVEGDTNNTYDIFVHDRETGTTERISVNSDGIEGNNHSLEPFISADGSHISFRSLASNLVAGDTNDRPDNFAVENPLYVPEDIVTEPPALENTGTGNFTDSGQSLGNSSSQGVSLGDLDGDGDLDAFSSNFNNQPNKVWLNDGNGNFTDSGQSLGDSTSADVELKDLDGDGDLDAFIANFLRQPNKVWLNDGTGTFTDSGQSLGNSLSHSVSLGDLDGDGDLDAFSSNSNNQPNKIWLNDGNGNFTDSGQSLGSSNSLDIELEDLDGDGDLDAFVVNHGGEPNEVWLNDSTGTFTDSGQSLGSSNSYGVSLGDLDGDGNVDAFVANDNAQPNKIWLNDGNGNFTDSGQSLGSSNSLDVELEDLDGDGDLDAFVANFSSQVNKVWINDNGIFTDSSQSPGSSSYDVSLGDLDDNGSLDAFVVHQSKPNEVWFNEAVIPTANSIEGTPEDDFLEGTPEDDIITGLAGSDFLIGEGGNDQIEGGDDFDFIEAGEGNDTIDGGAGDDLMTGDAGNDLMLASPGFDSFDGGDGEDTADYSNIGAAIIFDADTIVDKGEAVIDEIFDVETIIGATDAANKIDGSTGVNDTSSFDVDLTANTLTVDDGEEPKIYMIENFVDVTGTPLDDIFAGNDADNTFLGSDGDDLFIGSIGDDKFGAGAGEDTADYSNLDAAVTFDAQTLVDKGANGVDEVLGVETIIGATDAANKIDGSTGVNDTSSLSVDLIANILTVDDGEEPKIYTVENFVDVTGTPLDDSLAGNDVDNTFLGNDGDDLFVGSLGNDLLDGGAGEDTADYSNLDAAITFDAQTEVDKGANGVDEVLAIETIIGASGQANTIDGSTAENDGNSFTINLGNDSLTVDNGETSITYTVENFLNAIGNSEKDILTGNDGDNLLIGNAGSDRLTGKAGADTLIGVDAASATPGAGERDRLTGGADADVFVLGDVEGAFYLDDNGSFGRRGIAIIQDFESGVDKIQLSGVADDYITRGSYIFADEGSRDGVLDRGDDMIAYARGGFEAEDMMFI